MTTSTAAVPWSARAASLLEAAGELGARAASTDEARRRTALLGLHCLAAFATKQFHLFEKGFAGGMLQADAAVPPEYVLEATARQVGFDIDVLLRTIGQREPSISTAPMRDTLDLADKLAADALAGAVRSRLIEETAVLTYFQKTPTIRLLPYVPLALIGIDLTAIHDRAQLLAIAHEAGHHVYRQLTTNYSVEPQKKVEKRTLAAAPDQFPAWLRAWTEEVFADIYSVLVAGPVAGISVQAMLMSELPSVLLQDDADHPLPALRPEIAVAVLRKLAGDGKHGDGRARRWPRRQICCRSSGGPIWSCARSATPLRRQAAGSRCRWRRHGHSWKRMSAIGWTVSWRRLCVTPRLPGGAALGQPQICTTSLPRAALPWPARVRPNWMPSATR